MTTMKYSRQREEIKRCLDGRTDHPTAEMLYSELREKDPKLSLGTVYRNLALLTELGEIRKIPVSRGPDHFDGDTSGHFHFICRKCHQVRDLRMTDADRLVSQAERLIEGRVDEIVFTVYGLCRTCLGSEGAAPGSSEQ